MISKPIPVCVSAQRCDGPGDPLSVYLHAIEKRGKENSFILESLSGPSRDRKASIVGIDSLFSVSVYEDKACIDAEPSMQDFLLTQVSAQGFSLGGRDSVLIEEKEDAWELLRVLKALFSVEEAAVTSLAYFGYLSYDTIRFIEEIDSIAEDTADCPVIALTVFQTLVYFHTNGTVDVLTNNCPLWKERTAQDYDDILYAGKAKLEPVQFPREVVYQDTVDKSTFLGWVDKALEHIRIGDIYQLQLGHEVKITSAMSPADVYRILREKNPSPYMYLASISGFDLIGASPELFVRLSDDLIEMRPIAGTVGKKEGVSANELILSMTRSEKECAEHLMLVDLCRNDIGRVCQSGSLEVDEFMFVEEYSHLYHMVSNVRGLRKPGLDAFDVIKAAFPAGTMTGAPKVRAMGIIEQTERNRRGIYAGAVGIIGFDGTINTALCIRSTVHQDGVYSIRASAGVVADSDPEKEWIETFYKMGSVYYAITGKEMLK